MSNQNCTLSRVGSTTVASASPTAHGLKFSKLADTRKSPAKNLEFSTASKKSDFDAGAEQTAKSSKSTQTKRANVTARGN